MTQDPTPYDLLQDAAIEGLQEVVTPYYAPPETGELSFPIVGQGVNADMYQQMSLGQGDGVIMRVDSDNSHTLTYMPGGATETNMTNQMILRAGQGSGKGEAVLGGSYHVFYGDMPLEFPPVTTPTKYYVCITKDPRKEENPAEYLKIEVWANDIPRTHGRTHLVLHEVERQPNQLLSDATVTLRRQVVSPTVTVTHPDLLPDTRDVLTNTIGFVRNRVVGGQQIEGTGHVYEARGEYGWKNLLIGELQPLQILTGSQWSGAGHCRRQIGGLALNASITGRQGGSVNRVPMFRLPEEYRLSRGFYTVVYHDNGVDRFEIVDNPSSGRVEGQLRTTRTTPPEWTHVNVTIPDYFFSQGF